MAPPAPDPVVNVGDACTRLQCALGRGDKEAFRWVAPGAERRAFTFADLEAESGRAASALRGLGLAPGDVVFTFLPKLPQQLFAFLGALRARLLVGTLFSSFGEDALADRLADSGARAVLTRRSLVRKVLAARARVPSLRHVLAVDLDEDADDVVRSWPKLLAAASPAFAPEPTAPETPSVLHYTSGSTGKPKGVLHVHGSLPSQRGTAAEVLGLRDDDVYWCTADQGWVTGTSYGIIGTLEPRGDPGPLRRRVRSRGLAPAAPGRADHGLVHGAHRAADADRGSRRPSSRRTTSPACGRSSAWASRSTPR